MSDIWLNGLRRPLGDWDFFFSLQVGENLIFEAILIILPCCIAFKGDNNDFGLSDPLYLGSFFTLLTSANLTPF
jgi:hypothetical protein